MTVEFETIVNASIGLAGTRFGWYTNRYTTILVIPVDLILALIVIVIEVLDTGTSNGSPLIQKSFHNEQYETPDSWKCP